MYLLTILASVTALASYAVAAPTKTSGGDDAGVCGNNQKLACWNSELDLLGINCLSVPIRKSRRRWSSVRRKCALTSAPATVDVPIQQSCGSEVPACCPTQEDVSFIDSDTLSDISNLTLRRQDGLINLNAQCVVIQL